MLAIDDPEASVRTASTVRRHFPTLPIYARARNRQHAFRLMDLRVEAATRETLHSSLALAERVLAGLGVSDTEARDTVTRFKEHDEATLRTQHAIYRDEAKLIQTTRAAAEQLKELFESDPTARRGGGR